MQPQDRERIVGGFIEYTELLRADDSEDGPGPSPATEAYEALNDAIRKGPPSEAYSLVVELLRRASDDRLDEFAAGPLENLVIRWGSELVVDIEQEAARDERFRWALGRIWINVDDLPPDVIVRIVAASDSQILRFDGEGDDVRALAPNPRSVND